MFGTRPARRPAGLHSALRRAHRRAPIRLRFFARRGCGPPGRIRAARGPSWRTSRKGVVSAPSVHGAAYPSTFGASAAVDAVPHSFADTVEMARDKASGRGRRSSGCCTSSARSGRSRPARPPPLRVRPFLAVVGTRRLRRDEPGPRHHGDRQVPSLPPGSRPRAAMRPSGRCAPQESRRSRHRQPRRPAVPPRRCDTGDVTGNDRQTDRRLEKTILELLERRGPTATICPSDAARAVYTGDDDGWRALMEPARRAARRLVTAGEVEITQGGRPVAPDKARGPIRIRRRLH